MLNVQASSNEFWACNGDSENYYLFSTAQNSAYFLFPNSYGIVLLSLKTHDHKYQKIAVTMHPRSIAYQKEVNFYFMNPQDFFGADFKVGQTTFLCTFLGFFVCDFSLHGININFSTNCERKLVIFMT